jgi:hypothetical protein
MLRSQWEDFIYAERRLSCPKERLFLRAEKAKIKRASHLVIEGKRI